MARIAVESDVKIIRGDLLIPTKAERTDNDQPAAAAALLLLLLLLLLIQLLDIKK